MQDRPYERIHFGTTQRAAIRRLRRGVSTVIACAVLAPGLAIVVGAFAVGHNPPLVVVGVAFLAVGFTIAQAIITAVDDVLVVNGSVRWRGPWVSGEAALSALQRIRPAPWPKRALRFDFGGAKFDMPPARGTDMFLDELRRLKPEVVMNYPRSLQRLEFLQRWRLDVTNDPTPTAGSAR